MPTSPRSGWSQGRSWEKMGPWKMAKAGNLDVSAAHRQHRCMSPTWMWGRKSKCDQVLRFTLPVLGVHHLLGGLATRNGQHPMKMWSSKARIQGYPPNSLVIYQGIPKQVEPPRSKRARTDFDFSSWWVGAKLQKKMETAEPVKMGCSKNRVQHSILWFIIWSSFP